jgi:hypothetical protein
MVRIGSMKLRKFMNITRKILKQKDETIMEIEKVKKEADQLMIKKIEYYEKELALVREDAQIEILNQTKKHADNIFEKDNRIKELEIINSEHQKLNGELREDNKKLAKQIDDYVNKLRKAGLI